MRASAQFTAADLFCGAGGFTTGAEQAGVRVVLAVNHWRTAVFSHRANHPETRHICARIDDVDPRYDKTLPDLDVLLASPECTYHSNAGGGRPVDDQRRATPWHVLHWTECKRPSWVLVENVREFRDWGPLIQKRDKNGSLLFQKDGRPWMVPDKHHKGDTFRQWTKILESLGYQVDWQLLNAADFGAATKRVRLFVMAKRRDVPGDIPWPVPTHHREDWTPAWSIIDWSIPCPSIFGRKRPLAEKTLKRIEAGLRKFVGPFAMTLRRNMAGRDLGLPLPTITAGAEHHGLAVPLQFKAMGRSPGATKGIDTPVPTIVAARENHAVIVPHLLDVNHGGDDDRSHSLNKPLQTLTTKNGHVLVVPFLVKYYGTGGAVPVTDPLDTITTKNRFGLAMTSLVQTMRELSVIDIGFRMLDVDELLAAQGFDRDYQLFGNKAERIKQVGNSVCPPVAKALCGAIIGD